MKTGYFTIIGTYVILSLYFLGPNHMGLKSCWRSWSCFYAVYAYLGLAMTLVCFVEPLLNRSLSYDGFCEYFFFFF